MTSEPGSRLLDIYDLVNNEINNHSFQEGEEAYLLSNKWYARYKRAKNQNKLDQFSHPINNSHLYDDQNRLKISIANKRDFLLISKKAWENLLTVYKLESPAQIIKYVANPDNSKVNKSKCIPDLHPIYFKIHWKANQTQLIVSISPYDSVKQLKIECIKKFNLNKAKLVTDELFETKIRLIDYYLSQIREILDDSRSILSYHFPPNPELLLEIQGEQGLWTPQSEYSSNLPKNVSAGGYQASPGLVGLKKQNNPYTALSYLCYQAATIQALSHCEPLVKFVQSLSISSGKPILEAFKDIVMSIWAPKDNRPIGQNKLNETIGQKKKRFLTNEQQDAQDFLETLFDYIIGQTSTNSNHENIQFVQLQSSNGVQSADQQSAETNWSNLIKTNDSPLYPMFYGLQSETFECLTCKTLNTSFTPSSIIQLHKDILIKRQREYIYVPYHCDSQSRPRKIVLKTTADFVSELSKHKIPFDSNTSTILFAYTDDRDGLVFTKNQNHESDKPLIAFEVPDKTKNYFIAKFDLIYQNVMPFFLCMFNDAINENEAKRIAQIRLKDNLYREQKVVVVNSESPDFFTSVTVSGSFKQNDHFEFIYDYVVHTSVLLEKCDYSKQQIFVDTQKPHFDITDILNERASKHVFDVSKRCNTCDKDTEQMNSCQFWKLPEILIFHIVSSRFSPVGLVVDQNEQLKVELDYPKQLDMTPYVESSQRTGSMMYKLFAVTVRIGYNIETGHYYTFALHHENQRWWSFDDEFVSSVNESEVHTQNAYLLFYQRIKESK